jgi:hypothetical protein
MASSQQDFPGSQPVTQGTYKEAGIYEDEINLIDYLNILWKRKFLILLGSVLPAFIVGLSLFLSTGKYKITYVYDISRWGLDEKNYNVLVEQFYSEENINQILDELQKNGVADYARLISKAKSREDLKKFIDIEVLPPFLDLSKEKITDPGQLEQLRQSKALLLKLTIIGKPKNDVSKTSLIIRNNLENVMPAYLVQEQLNAALWECRARMADIEENRFNTGLTLKTNKSTLAKLKNIKAGITGEIQSGLVLQFNIGNNSEYLPVERQIQAAESKTIQLEEQIAAEEEKYKYYGNLLALNQKLLAELKNHALSHHTIQQFQVFVSGLLDSYNDKELKDYLNLLLKKLDNRISTGVPITERPEVYPVGKGTVKKSVIVLMISLMISVFAAFLLEGLKKRPAQVS